MMSHQQQHHNGTPFTRQAVILRKNLVEWDRMLRNTRGEDWSTMLGRLNAAWHQTVHMDRTVEDVMEHFVYLPKKTTANAQDIPFFLSTRMETSPEDVPPPTLVSSNSSTVDDSTIDSIHDAAVQRLARYESCTAKLATEYEERMVRF